MEERILEGLGLRLVVRATLVGAGNWEISIAAHESPLGRVPLRNPVAMELFHAENRPPQDCSSSILRRSPEELEDLWR